MDCTRRPKLAAFSVGSCVIVCNFRLKLSTSLRPQYCCLRSHNKGPIVSHWVKRAANPVAADSFNLKASAFNIQGSEAGPKASRIFRIDEQKTGSKSACP